MSFVVLDYNFTFDEEPDVSEIVDNKGIFHEFNKGYKHEGKDVRMGEPRACSYSKTDYEYNENHNSKIVVKEIIAIGKQVPRQKSPKGSVDITPMPVELRGITLRQLRAIKVNVERRCKTEKWKGWKRKRLTP